MYFIVHFEMCRLDAVNDRKCRSVKRISDFNFKIFYSQNVMKEHSEVFLKFPNSFQKK